MEDPNSPLWKTKEAAQPFSAWCSWECLPEVCCFGYFCAFFYDKMFMDSKSVPIKTRKNLTSISALCRFENMCFLFKNCLYPLEWSRKCWKFLALPVSQACYNIPSLKLLSRCSSFSHSVGYGLVPLKNSRQVQKATLEALIQHFHRKVHHHQFQMRSWMLEKHLPQQKLSRSTNKIDSKRQTKKVADLSFRKKRQKFPRFLLALWFFQIGALSNCPYLLHFHSRKAKMRCQNGHFMKVCMPQTARIHSWQKPLWKKKRGPPATKFFCLKSMDGIIIIHHSSFIITKRHWTSKRLQPPNSAWANRAPLFCWVWQLQQRGAQYLEPFIRHSWLFTSSSILHPSSVTLTFIAFNQCFLLLHVGRKTFMKGIRVFTAIIWW